MADAYIYLRFFDVCIRPAQRGYILQNSNFMVTIDILCHMYNLLNYINIIITPTSVILVLHEGDVATLTETLLLEPVPAAFVASQV